MSLTSHFFTATNEVIGPKNDRRVEMLDRETGLVVCDLNQDDAIYLVKNWTYFAHAGADEIDGNSNEFTSHGLNFIFNGLKKYQRSNPVTAEYIVTQNQEFDRVARVLKEDSRSKSRVGRFIETAVSWVFK